MTTWGNGSDADWRAYSDAFNPADGLIDPSKIPSIPINIGAMQAAGSKIKSAGIKVQGAGETIDRTWQRLGSFYRAPETPQLLNGSVLVTRKAADVQTRLNEIGDAVWHFAAEMQGLNGQLEGLRAQAWAFVAWAHMIGPAAWPDQTYKGSKMTGQGYNDKLAHSVGKVLSQVREIEARYAGQIACAFDSTYNPPMGKPQPFHSRTEAEDAAASVPDNWRDLDLAGVGLPWGGARTDTMDQFFDGICQSVLSTVLALPGLVGVGLDHGHLNWSLKNAKNSWVGLGRMAMATNPTTWASPALAAANVKTLSMAFNGFIGRDANGNWGAKGAGRMVGNVGALFIPGVDDLAAGAMASKGAALAERGGMWAAAGRALQAPKWITTGGWVGLDARGLRGVMDDTSLLGRLADAPANNWHLPSNLHAEASKFATESRGALARHQDAVDDVTRTTSAAHAEFGRKVQSDYQSMVEKARAEAAGKSPAERTRIFDQLKEQARQASDRASQMHRAIGDQGERQKAAAADRYHDQLNDLRDKHGSPPASKTQPAGLPESEQSVKDRLMSAGMGEHAATEGAQELEHLMRSRTPIRDWTADQRALLATYWSRLPAGLREYFHGEYGWDAATSSPAPADPPQQPHGPAIPDYTDPRSRPDDPAFPDYAGMLSG